MGLRPQGVHSHRLPCGAAGPRGVLLTSEGGFSLRRDQRVWEQAVTSTQVNIALFEVPRQARFAVGVRPYLSAEQRM